jgi:hypothetical protein
VATHLLKVSQYFIVGRAGRARGVAASGVHGFEVAAQLHGYIQIKNFVMVAVASEAEYTILGFAVSVLSKTHTA